MASLNFYLNRPGAKTSGIHFLLNYGAFELRNDRKVYLPFKYYLDESIETVNWGKGKAKMLKTYPQYLEFNPHCVYFFVKSRKTNIYNLSSSNFCTTTFSVFILIAESECVFDTLQIHGGKGQSQFTNKQYPPVYYKWI